MSYEDKVSIGFYPSEGESLRGYADRIRLIVQEKEGHLLSHFNWHTHRGTGPCPICEITVMARFTTNILLDISLMLDKKKKFMRCERPKGVTDPASFVFRIVSS